MWLPYRARSHAKLSTLHVAHLRNKYLMTSCGIEDSLFCKICVSGHIMYSEFDVGGTLFHFRLFCSARTFGILVIAVTASRPVVAASLCISEEFDEHVNTSAAASERCNYWVRVFVTNSVICMVRKTVFHQSAMTAHALRRLLLLGTMPPKSKSNSSQSQVDRSRHQGDARRRRRKLQMLCAARLNAMSRRT